MTTREKSWQYITPEQAFKQSDQFKQDGNWEDSIQVIHFALQNRRNKSNTTVMEKLMLKLINLCVENTTTMCLKDDVAHFRNLCQHSDQSLKQLESVLKYLVKESYKCVEKVQQEHGIEKIISVLSESEEADFIQQQETSPQHLILLANCNIESIQAKREILPKINFFTEVCKTILDTLRQNSRLLDLYASTVNKLFEMSARYKSATEFKKASDTLHAHFNQIMKQHKNPELLKKSNIPHPVTLDEKDGCLLSLLEIRQNQLRFGLGAKQWTDAFRTCENIYQLINRGNAQTTKIKNYLHDFFSNLAEIFWESEYQMFHSYALMNVYSIVKSNKTLEQSEKNQIASKFVLASLAIPLHDSIGNFDKISAQYLPQSVQNDISASTDVRNELFGIAQMLLIKGLPSRKSLIHQISMKNIHRSTENEHVLKLFDLVEHQESPFKISCEGRVALDALIKQDPSFEKYKSFIIKTIAVRILQKCKNYYKNMKFEGLKKLLVYFDTFEEIETLLYECNRQGLVCTVIDHKQQSIQFNEEEQVQTNLMQFGAQLRDAFQKISETQTQGNERMRIFMKVKEKLDEETAAVRQQRDDMIKNKEQIAKNQLEEMQLAAQKREEEALQKQREFEAQQIKDAQQRQRNELLDNLNQERQMRARQVIGELVVRGIKKIGKEKIQDIEQREEIDYDQILQFYQNLLRKEAEHSEEQKKKKARDVELWARALREEEKIAVVKHCEEHGEDEMQQIKQAIMDRHTKELQNKRGLESATGAYKKFKMKLQNQAAEAHKQAQIKFINQIGEEVKEKILQAANGELQKLLIKQANEIAAQKRLLRDAEIKRKEAQERADKGEPEPEEEELGEGGFFKRGTGISDARKNAEASERPIRERKEPTEDTGFLGRSQMNTRQADAPPEFTRKPREPKKDDGPISFTRGSMFKKSNEEEKKEEAPKRTGPPTYSRGNKKADDSGADAFKRGNAPTKASGGPPTFSRGGGGNAQKKKDDNSGGMFARSSKTTKK